LWRLHAEHPARDARDQAAGSYIDFYVNADKGFMVQKAVLYATHSYLIDGKSLGCCHSLEVKEFQSCGDGVFFPKRTERRKQVGVEQISADRTDCVTFAATKLSVNSPLAGDAFDFRIPAGVTVYEWDENLSMERGKVYIWGADNKPAQKFASEREYLDHDAPRVLEEMRQSVEKNLASKKPKDLTERGYYYIMARKYDEAIATYTQWVAADPKPGERAGAVELRGITYLLKQDYDKAVVDLTEAMRLAEKLDKKGDMADCADLYALRSLAYASQENTLDKAMSDLTKIEDLPDIHGDWIAGYWAPLLRTAIRIRHLDFSSVGQGKAKTGRETGKPITDTLKSLGSRQDPEAQAMIRTFMDLQRSMGNRAGPEAWAMQIYFLDKMGDHAMAAKLREGAKRYTVSPADLDCFAEVDAAFHKCLVRLLPEIKSK